MDHWEKVFGDRGFARSIGLRSILQQHLQMILACVAVLERKCKFLLYLRPIISCLIYGNCVREGDFDGRTIYFQKLHFVKRVHIQV